MRRWWKYVKFEIVNCKLCLSADHLLIGCDLLALNHVLPTISNISPVGRLGGYKYAYTLILLDEYLAAFFARHAKAALKINSTGQASF